MQKIKEHLKSSVNIDSDKLIQFFSRKTLNKSFHRTNKNNSTYLMNILKNII